MQKHTGSPPYQLEELFSDTNAILLAMKPKDALNALSAIKPYINENTLIISVLAGVSIESIEQILEKPSAIVRAILILPLQLENLLQSCHE